MPTMARQEQCEHFVPDDSLHKRPSSIYMGFLGADFSDKRTEEGIIFVSHVRVQSIVAGKARWQGHEAEGHIVSAVHKDQTGRGSGP